uniref:Uncharacterized protein n=1 Tax=Calidris pygmaea TaxID=425635 RepID=A0A8C3PMC0_9CHAR
TEQSVQKTARKTRTSRQISPKHKGLPTSVPVLLFLGRRVSLFLSTVVWGMKAGQTHEFKKIPWWC